MKVGVQECFLYEVKDGFYIKVFVYYYIKQDLDNEIDDFQEGDWYRLNKQGLKGVKIGLKDYLDQFQ